MTGSRGRVLCDRAVDALGADGRDRIVWDSGLPGFGVRVYPSGRKVYVAQARAGGAPRRVTLGAHGEIDAARARARAEAALARIRTGGAGRRGGPRVAELAERYLGAHVAANCNAHTAGIYRGSLRNHILPALGALPIAAVARADVAALHRSLKETPRAANRALAILKKMFALAEDWGMAPEGANPCAGVRKYRERRRERFLTPEEYRRLGAALASAEREGKASAVAALRLLALTGCRLGEILGLRWDDVDRAAGELRLRGGKAGARAVPLTPEVEAVLAAIPRGGNPWVIAGRRPLSRATSITAEWHRIRARAGLGDVRIHDLRHSYATRALGAGESLAMIGRLLGHADIASTLRYAHLAHGAERESAARVGRSIGASLDTPLRGYSG